VASKTAESLLFHREGDEIVYLNELRHFEKTVMELRLPVTNEKLPAAMALEGIRETTKGVDYRGVQVLAAMNKVPESQWYMVAKIDRAEVFEDLSGVVKMVIIVVTLVILTTGFFIGLLWWNQRGRFYRSKYEAELERMALVRHYDYILRHANDIIILFDRDYNIMEANDKAVGTYGFAREDLIGKNVIELRAPESRDDINEDLKELETLGYSTFETVHRRKDQTTFPIEISARKFEIEGTLFYQSISRDITERKISEETLR
jgi:PAS domain S-box-containing protein